MSNRFRIMFTLRLPNELSYLLLVGCDYSNGCLFAINLFSPNDSIQLNRNVNQYPEELIAHLSAEKELIDAGFYDLRTWQLTLFQLKIKERKDFQMIKDRGEIKWQPFQSIPELWNSYRAIQEEQSKISKPSLDEDQLEIINYRIMKSLEEEKVLNLKLYEQGHINEVPGIIIKVDPFQKVIRFKVTSGAIKQLSFSKIVGAELFEA
ncbi:YolD-like family protein [Fictibacillus sp. 26RED30]|uniref:YolD-like family protein n=1 Tax=Fictibacillus sp. 26RED30 TaxID=2745877 RepID=UPI0018CC8FC9|nr:YolD-like family protein [Fictibacillus sp. 26RED30]MBH0162079.1 YolD-like family protein [Fictibacillus sp. 26RED30]